MEPPPEASAVLGPPADPLSDPGSSAAQGAPPSVGTGGLRILVAEDNPVNATVAVKMLERRGYHADLARDGRQAVEMLTGSAYDAVLMDCQMPELDGYEATGEIRRREVGGTHTPVIAMTAHSMTGDREKCLAAGMDDYLSKPIRSEALHEMLLRWVQARADDAEGQASKAPGPENEIALVDYDVVDDLLGAGTEVAASIVDLYVGEATSLVAAIRDHVSAGDAAALADRAHLLKGGSASVGAARMAALAGRLEESGRAATLEQAPAYIEALAGVLEPSAAALREAVGASGALPAPALSGPRQAAGSPR